jgi:integrase
MSAVSSFFDYLCKPPSPNQEPLLRYNPFSAVPRNDIRPTPYGRAQAMEWTTFQTILKAMPTDAIGIRDKAILIFYAFTSRRRAEVASLRVRDLNLKSNPRSYTVRVKGGQVKTFELPDICYDAIRAYWVAADRLYNLRADAGIFTPSTSCSLTSHLDPHRPLSNRSMNVILTRAAERAGLDHRNDVSICLHAIRHMTARDLDRAGINLQDIQAMLGHASPLTTQIYLDRLSGPAPAHTETLLRVRAETAELARDLLD